MNERYIVLSKTECLGVFMYEEDAELFIKSKIEEDELVSLGSGMALYELKEIEVEDVHEYL